MNKNTAKNIPLVSIVIITYGHEKFIDETINGVVMQETNFDFELIIADDCSPDNTSNLVNDFIINHPKGYLIKYFRHEKNIGMMTNFLFALKECKGKYIALCEGDDYWTDSLKLQKQVDFLENNNDYNLTGHYSKSSEGKELGIFNSDTFEFKDVYQKNIRIPTASIVYRNNFKFPNWFSNVYGGDRAIIFLNAQKGKLKVLPFFGSFYRLHEGGVESILKKDKFKVAIRNIKEEYIYYNLLKNELDVSIIKKRILKNHYYIIALGVKKMKPFKFLTSIKSLIYFYLNDEIKF